MDTSKETTNETSTNAADEAAKIADAAKPADAPAAAATSERIVEPAKNGAPVAIPTVEALKPETIKTAASENPKIASPKIEIAPIAAAPLAPKPIAPGARRFSLMAASIALATACGALAGALGTSGLVARAPASESAPSIDEIRVMKDAIAQLRVDIAALKASVDTANRTANAQMSKISERFERADRLQTEAAPKLARETTGSIASAAPAAAVPLPPPTPALPIVSGWVVRDVSRGMALIQGRIGLIEVEPGDVVPGLGRIEAVRRQDGRWVVVTARGIIASR